MDIQKDEMERPETGKSGAAPEHALDDPITLWTQNCLERDTEYKNLLSHYVSQQKLTDKAQFWFRMIFFIIICAVFLFVVIVGMLGKRTYHLDRYWCCICRFGEYSECDYSSAQQDSRTSFPGFWD